MSQLLKESLLKVPEVMERLSLSRTMVYRLVREGSLQKVKIGTSVRFKESEIRRFITELELSK